MSAIQSWIQARTQGGRRSVLTLLVVALTAIPVLALAGEAHAETYQSQANTSLYIVDYSSSTNDLGTYNSDGNYTSWTPVYEDSYGYVDLQNNAYGNCINVSGGSIANGTRILGYTCSSSAVNEKWRGYYTSGTTLMLATELSSTSVADNCLYDSSTGSGNTSLVLEGCNSSSRADNWK